MKKVLVLTTEPLPIPGSATTGAGLRAWGLGEGLRAAGLNIFIGTPLYGTTSAPADLPADYRHVRFFRREAIGELLQEVQPDVVVLQHWGMASEVPELQVPLVIDLAGPHLLERLFWANSGSVDHLREKLTALSRADFVTCSGEYQRHYFYPFLLMAGFQLQELEVPVIPFSVPANPPFPLKTQRPQEPTFVYGGVFLAWQNPSAAIRWLLEEMDSAGRGRLLFYGGHHPVFDASGGRFDELIHFLEQHPRVEIRGFRSFDQLVAEYSSEADVALDLMARNPERELAFTTRTMVYLYCGLPVIYNNYSELSGVIDQRRCGWALDPSDEGAVRAVFRGILNGDIELGPYAIRAAETARDYSWAATIRPLADYCASPAFRADKASSPRLAPVPGNQSAGGAIGAFRDRWRPARIRDLPGKLAAAVLRSYLWLKKRVPGVGKPHV